MAKKTIVICSSAAFYEHCNQIADQLRSMGYEVRVPATAERMKKEANYDVTRVKIWYENPEFAQRKKKLAKEHFDKVAASDAILIVNDDKPGKPKYIGPNGTMEWGLAHYLGKPIYLLNSVSKDHNAYEEVLGMTTAVLDGDLTKIKL